MGSKPFSPTQRVSLGPPTRINSSSPPPPSPSRRTMIVSPSPLRPASTAASTPLSTHSPAVSPRTPSPPSVAPRTTPPLAADAAAAYRPARSSPLADAPVSELKKGSGAAQVSHHEILVAAADAADDADSENDAASIASSSSSGHSRRSTATVSTDSESGTDDDDDDLPAFESWLSGPNSIAATRAAASAARPLSQSMRRSSSHPPPPMLSSTRSSNSPSTTGATDKPNVSAVARPRFPHQAPLRPLPRSLAAMGIKPLSLLPPSTSSASSPGSKSAPSTPSIDLRKGGFSFTSSASSTGSAPNPNMGRPSANAGSGRTKIIVPSRSKKWSTCFELGLSQQELARME